MNESESDLNIFANLNLPSDIELKLTKMILKQDDIIDSIKVANKFLKTASPTENFVENFVDKLNDIKTNFVSYNDILKSIDPKIESINIENFECASGTPRALCDFANTLARPFTDAVDKVKKFIDDNDPKAFFERTGKTILSGITGTFNTIIDSINKFIKGIKDGFESLFKSIEKFFVDFGIAIGGPFIAIFTVVKSIVEFITVVARNIIQVLIDLPYIIQYSWDIVNMLYIFAQKLYKAPLGTVVLALIGTLVNILYFRMLFGVEPDPMFSVFVGSIIGLTVMYYNNDDAVMVQEQVIKANVTTSISVSGLVTILFVILQFIKL